MCFGGSRPSTPQPEPAPAPPLPEQEGATVATARNQRRRANLQQNTTFTTPLGSTGFGQSSQGPTLFGTTGTAF